MTRRSFLKGLALTCAAVSVSSKLMSDTLTATKPPNSHTRYVIRPNAAYYAAQYEEVYVFHPSVFNKLNPWGNRIEIRERDFQPTPKDWGRIGLKYPRRFTHANEETEVFPFIKIPIFAL